MKPDRGPIFTGLRPPRVPDDLERRVLDAAARAADEPQQPTLWDRLWTSKPLRAAWGLTTGALLVAHVVLSFPEHRASRTDDAAISADARHPEDLGEVLRLPHLEISPRAARLCLGPSRRPSPEVDPSETENVEDAS
jgi:hypothetical protein